ncbi:MAG TPA: hypothetical protein PK322_01655, partial [Opitutaceae bacterium]|nr:hypothetical protein [Opitutaceae bacterium]
MPTANRPLFTGYRLLFVHRSPPTGYRPPFTAYLPPPIGHHRQPIPRAETHRCAAARAGIDALTRIATGKP